MLPLCTMDTTLLCLLSILAGAFKEYFPQTQYFSATERIWDVNFGCLFIHRPPADTGLTGAVKIRWLQQCLSRNARGQQHDMFQYIGLQNQVSNVRGLQYLLDAIPGSFLVQSPTLGSVSGICLIPVDVHLSHTCANPMALPSSLYWCSTIPTIQQASPRYGLNHPVYYFSSQFLKLLNHSVYYFSSQFLKLPKAGIRKRLSSFCRRTFTQLKTITDFLLRFISETLSVPSVFPSFQVGSSRHFLL